MFSTVAISHILPETIDSSGYIFADSMSVTSSISELQTSENVPVSQVTC